MHDDASTKPSRTSRTLAATGIKPWNPKRLAVVAWVLVFLGALGSSTTSGIAFLAATALVAATVAGRRYWRDRMTEPEQIQPTRPVPGPAWCDHCADWTVHVTDEHAVA